MVSVGWFHSDRRTIPPSPSALPKECWSRTRSSCAVRLSSAISVGLSMPFSTMNPSSWYCCNCAGVSLVIGRSGERSRNAPSIRRRNRRFVEVSAAAPRPIFRNADRLWAEVPPPPPVLRKVSLLQGLGVKVHETKDLEASVEQNKGVMAAARRECLYFRDKAPG